MRRMLIDDDDAIGRLRKDIGPWSCARAAPSGNRARLFRARLQPSEPRDCRCPAARLRQKPCTAFGEAATGRADAEGIAGARPRSAQCRSRHRGGSAMPGRRQAHASKRRRSARAPARLRGSAPRPWPDARSHRPLPAEAQGTAPARVAVAGEEILIGAAHRAEQQPVTHRPAIDEQILRAGGAAVVVSAARQSR